MNKELLKKVIHHYKKTLEFYKMVRDEEVLDICNIHLGICFCANREFKDPYFYTNSLVSDISKNIGYWFETPLLLPGYFDFNVKAIEARIKMMEAILEDRCFSELCEIRKSLSLTIPRIK